MNDQKEDIKVSILDRPPKEPDGDNQKAKTDDDVEIVTRVDFADADELDDIDPEPEYGDDDA